MVALWLLSLHAYGIVWLIETSFYATHITSLTRLDILPNSAARHVIWIAKPIQHHLKIPQGCNNNNNTLPAY